MNWEASKDNLEAKIDLHIHSTFSDSDLTIEDIFKIARLKELSAIAITDHDTVDGMEEAKRFSAIYGIELIEGIELSTQKDDTEVHMLGYFLDSSNPKLKEELKNVRKLRKERLSGMIEKLNQLGFNLDEAAIFSRIKNAMPTRLHLGLELVRKGKVKTLREAFEKYLSPGKPGYLSRFKYSIKEGIELIKRYGGLAFLAHPHLIPEQSWIEEFVSLGIDGLEVVYPRFSPAKILLYKEKADKFGLLKSGGSDAHGSYKEFIQIGEVFAPYAWVVDMKKRINISK
jgi:hypothetical protein